ncbi:hypothetical protein ACO0QE_002468 [Hanseniaspora vineae]
MSSNSTFEETFEEAAKASAANLKSKISVYTPFIYLAIVIISLYVFSSKYRKRELVKKATLPSIFEDDEPRQLYYEIKALKQDPEHKVHDKVLQAALLNRGAEAIRRTFKLKESQPQLEILFKMGVMGDEYHERCEREMKLTDLEFKECVQEAETMQPGFAQNFVNLSREICFNEALRRRYNSIEIRKQVLSAQLDN